MTFYCQADGGGPKETVDWRARQREVELISDETDRQAAQDALFEQRSLEASHVVRNGNGPLSSELNSREVAALLLGGAVIERIGPADEFGGQLAQLAVDGSTKVDLRCPECSGPIRVA